MRSLSTLSLLACLLLAGWWALAELPPSRWGRIGDCIVVVFCDDRGYLYPVEEVRSDDPLGNRVTNLLRTVGGGGSVPPHRFTYVSGQVRESPTRVMRWWLVAIPFWSLVLLTATPPVIRAAVAVRRRRRRRGGVCARCGYDLRATPDRCPECGTIPAR